MKRTITVGLLAALSVVVLMPGTAAASTALEERVKQMEQELAELKALIQQEKQQNAVAVKSIETQVAEVKSSKGGSNLKLSKDTTLNYGGFIKVNAMYSDYSDGPKPGNIGDEILVPSTIPIGGESDSAHFDSDVKTSRFFFKTATDTDVGMIKSHLELDLLTASGDERISNSATSRVRHAYLAWDYASDASLLVGQSWSTFFNVGALPEAVEFIGPTSGTIFNRQAQIRWTKKLGSGSLMLALENPSTSLSDAGSGIEGNNFDDNSVPDIIARYNGKSGKHAWTLAAMGREIGVDDGPINESEFGYALNFSGKYVLENGDDLKYSFSHGNLGRYIALNAFRDGGIDATGDLDLTTVTGGYVAYRHHWSDKLRSTIQYALSTADLADGLSSANTEKVDNFNLNLMYSPTDRLTFGGAYIKASRELENGDDGDLDRFQLTAKFAF